MDRTLTNFIRSLRMADVRVSTAETLDAMSTVELVGYRDREFLKHSLALVLPKTADEKERYELCFDQFFAFQDIQGEEGQASESDAEGGEESGEASGESGEGGSAGGRPVHDPELERLIDSLNAKMETLIPDDHDLNR